MSEWSKYNLRQIINLKRGYDLPNSKRENGDIPIISSSGISGSHNDYKEVGPGVVTGRYGTLGKIFYIHPNQKYWPLNTTLFVEDFKGNVPEYIFYFLKTLGFAKQGHKSAVPGLNRNELHEIHVKIPEIKIQKQIAKTLSILDDKITLLRQQNQTLEELAQTLFKRWFVEFEFPFDYAQGKPDENGRPYKSSGGKMMESELGEIPEGWRVGQYGDIVKISSGKGLKKEYFIENGSFEVLGANGRLGFSDEYLINEEAIITGRVGTLGTVFLVREPVWLSDNVLISRPLEKHILYFAYFTLKRFNFNSLNRGSTQPLITQGDLKLVDILIPDNSYLKKFHDVTEELFLKIFSNDKEIQTLTQLRDTLLPKLMSGEVRVKM